MDKLFIIDLMPFLYKGHFVFLRNPRMTASGINTSALLGLASGLQSILKKEKPTHAVLAMDPGGARSDMRRTRLTRLSGRRCRRISRRPFPMRLSLRRR